MSESNQNNDICIVCGNAIDRSKTPRARICSTACRAKRHYYKTIEPTVDYVCVLCNKKFTVARKRGQWKKFCSLACRDKAKERAKEEKKLAYAVSIETTGRCAVCGNQFTKSRHQQRRKYCSQSCRTKSYKIHDINCTVCGRIFKGLKTSKCCSEECTEQAVAAASAKAAKVNRERGRVSRERKAKKKQERRDRIAKALRMHRRGMTKDEIAITIGVDVSSVDGFLLQSRQYKKISQKRLKKSRYYDTEVGQNKRSALFRNEKQFSDYAERCFSGVFDVVEREVVLPGTRRRIDLVVRAGVFVFGVELKATSRTSRIDQLIGQCLVKCNRLQMTPVCAIPDDLSIDSVALEACKKYGVIVGTLRDVIQKMKEKSRKEQ
jgi:hypothetical protein